MITRTTLSKSVIIAALVCLAYLPAVAGPADPTDNNAADVTTVLTESAFNSRIEYLCASLKEQCDGKDFKTALSTVENIKALLDAQLQVSQKVAQPHSQAFADLYAKAEYPAILTFGGHTLKVDGDKDIFVSAVNPNSPDTSIEDRFDGEYLVTYDDEKLINDVYCKIDGRTEEIHYQSSDPNVVTVSNEEDKDSAAAGRITVHGVGNAVVTLTLAGQSLELPIKVTEIPIYEDMPTDDVIRLLGLPDSKTTDYVKWPDTKIFEGIAYQPSASDGYVDVEHWHYNKYPKVVFAVDGTEAVLYIHSLPW